VQLRQIELQRQAAAVQRQQTHSLQLQQQYQHHQPIVPGVAQPGAAGAAVAQPANPNVTLGTVAVAVASAAAEAAYDKGKALASEVGDKLSKFWSKP